VSQRQVQLPALAQRHPPLGRHREQRVRQPDQFVFADEQAAGDQILNGPGVGDRRELGEAQLPAQGRGQQRPASRFWQLGHPGPERVAGQVRGRQLSVDRRGLPLRQGPAQREREQRIALRDLEHPAERPRRQPQAKALREQPARFGQAQRA
jgi:hypothetical protein